jgi:hypothetical protein
MIDDLPCALNLHTCCCGRGQVMAEVTAEKLYPRPLVTELVPLTRFWPGEVRQCGGMKPSLAQAWHLCDNRLAKFVKHCAPAPAAFVGHLPCCDC